MNCLKHVFLFVFFLNIGAPILFAQHQELTQKKKISFKDSIDGAFDISEFLLDPKGFVVIPFLITEQATGFGGAPWVYSYGFGVRYRLAQVFGVDAGIDFAWSIDDDFAFSVVFGSAWAR